MRDTRSYWRDFKPVTDKGDEIYHLAGADKSVVSSGSALDAYTLMHYVYRFRFEEQLLSRFVQAHAKEKSRALDVGCGTGRNAVVLSQYFDQVDAFDLSEKFIAENKNRFSYIKNINFFTLDVNDLRALSGTYDFILLGGVLMCLSDDESATVLSWSHEHLSGGGMLVARDTISKEKTHYAEQLKIYRSRQEYEQLFPKTSFRLLYIASGPNRNIWMSIFARLPKFLQGLSPIARLFTWAALLWIPRDVARSLRQPFKRHIHANQLFYAYQNFV